MANGSFLVWGEVGKENTPHLVVPITVELTKPRVCHDERFLIVGLKTKDEEMIVAVNAIYAIA